MNQLIETMFRNRQYTNSFLKEIENYHHDVLQSSDDLCRRLFGLIALTGTNIDSCSKCGIYHISL